MFRGVGRQLSAQSEGCRQQFEFPVESPQDLLVMSVFFTPSQGETAVFVPQYVEQVGRVRAAVGASADKLSGFFGYVYTYLPSRFLSSVGNYPVLEIAFAQPCEVCKRHSPQEEEQCEPYLRFFEFPVQGSGDVECLSHFGRWECAFHVGTGSGIYMFEQSGHIVGEACQQRAVVYCPQHAQVGGHGVQLEHPLQQVPFEFVYRGDIKRFPHAYFVFWMFAFPVPLESP